MSPASPALPPLFDTHAHLDQPEFAEDCDQVVARAEQAGVTQLLSVGIGADSSQATVELAARHPAVLAAVGIHPNYTAQAAAEDWERVVALSREPKVVALGETGLDRYWDYAPFDVQRDYFARHLELSQKTGLPVVIHCREAEADLMPMLREAAGRGTLRGIIHAFSGDQTMAAECVQLGLMISFAGMVTYTNKKFAALRAVAAGVPAERLLIETDSPYLVPHPLRGKQKRNEPANVRLTAENLAQLRGVSPEHLAATTTANARRLLKLDA